MKKITILIALLFVASVCALYAQETDSTKINFSQRIPLVLEIEIKPTAVMAIGYANCFKAEVLKINRGYIKDSDIFITVLAGDDTNYNILTSADENSIFKINCIHYRDNEEFQTTIVTGFVDSKNTSWKIISIEKK